MFVRVPDRDSEMLASICIQQAGLWHVSQLRLKYTHMYAYLAVTNN